MVNHPCDRFWTVLFSFLLMIMMFATVMIATGYFVFYYTTRNRVECEAIVDCVNGITRQIKIQLTQQVNSTA